MRNPFIIGEKIYLRPVELTDVELFCRCANDPEVRYFFFIAFPTNTIRQKEFIESLYKEKDLIFFTIVTKEEDVPIGQTAFHRIDLISRAAIFSIIIEPPYWSKGYGSEAVKLMVDYGFNTLNLNRIQLHVWSENERAIKAYLKAGFKKEGVLRQAMYHNNKYCDFWVMAILREDYFKNIDPIIHNNQKLI